MRCSVKGVGVWQHFTIFRCIIINVTLHFQVTTQPEVNTRNYSPLNKVGNKISQLNVGGSESHNFVISPFARRHIRAYPAPANLRFSTKHLHYSPAIQLNSNCARTFRRDTRLIQFCSILHQYLCSVSVPWALVTKSHGVVLSWTWILRPGVHGIVLNANDRLVELASRWGGN